MSVPRVVYAANRMIGLRVLELLLEKGCTPIALLLPKGKSAEQVAEMQKLLPQVPVLWGNEFRSPEGIQRLRNLQPDYILSVHFPYVISAEVLQVSRIGTLNLHPAFLPFNKGWHTPTWAILENTPYGATLHWVDEGIDTGDIALRQQIEIYPDDTAHCLYQRVLKLELQLIEKAIPFMIAQKLPRIPQEGKGTTHTKQDIQGIQEIDLGKVMKTDEILRLLRALSTNSWQEATYFIVDGVQYRVRVEIQRGEPYDR